MYKISSLQERLAAAETTADSLRGALSGRTEELCALTGGDGPSDAEYGLLVSVPANARTVPHV